MDETDPPDPLLDINDLVVTFPGPSPVRALDGVSLGLARGECLGILGESGSGKSTLARSLLGLNAEATTSGTVMLEGRDLLALDERGWRDVRWRHIALGFQSTASLNPVIRVGDQLSEPLRVHLGLSRSDAEIRAMALLDDVGLGAWAAPRHPRELSGGQRRLVLLAMALSCRPAVAVLDEPTAGLDPATRNQVLDVLARTRREGDTALVIMSHDADALEVIADRVAVLYRGWLAEVGPAHQVLADPRNPYSWALLNARPTLASVKDLRGIRGTPPNPTERAEGCPFLGRCHQARDALCAPDRPPMAPPAGEHGPRTVACARGGVVALVRARDLRKSYPVPGALFRRRNVTVVDGVDLDVREGEVLGLVGATGAGKSTLGMLLSRLVEADSGSITFDGADLRAATGPALKGLRARVQMLFQDPFEALSPRLTIGEVVREPLDVQGVGDPSGRADVVRETIAECRLPADDAFLGRRAHELSGGQLQRVALARALVLRPQLLIADEAVSMLDPSEQAKMIQLLKHLQVERGMAMVFISHDLAVVLRVADRVLVLDRGCVVEEGAGGSMLMAPKSAVTRSLLAAAGRDTLLADLLAPDGASAPEATGPLGDGPVGAEPTRPTPAGSAR